MKKIVSSISVVLSLLILSACNPSQAHELSSKESKQEQIVQSQSKNNEKSQIIEEQNAPYDRNTYNQLASEEFISGKEPIVEVNNGQSTLDINSWETNKVIYGDLDQLNRTTYVTGYIDKKNLGRSEGREPQKWKPTGWNQKKIDGQHVVDRGHLLAYTSSFNFDMNGNYKEGENGSIDNPKNLATQTAFSNEKVQTYYETKVRNAQKITGNKVVYQIVTVFRGNELMPRGYWLQVKDSQGTLNFNVYEYNVQPNVKFDYATGRSEKDSSMKINWSHDNDQHKKHYK